MARPDAGPGATSDGADGGCACSAAGDRSAAPWLLVLALWPCIRRSRRA